jgi:hypothetical protein
MSLRWKARKALFFFLAATALSAVEPGPVGGVTTYGAEVVESIRSWGIAKLKGTTVRTLTEVHGALLAQSAHLATLEVDGEANLHDTTLSGPVTILGGLKTQNTIFKSTLTLQTQKATLASSKLQAITVRKDPACKGKQVLELRQGTQVYGPILFESGRGEVHIFPGSQLHGSISGGRAIKKG